MINRKSYLFIIDTTESINYRYETLTDIIQIL